MGERNLKLVADNKPRKRHILLLFACLAVVLGMGIYFLITDFSIQKIQISGNNTYTNAEIIEAMKEDGYIDNTLLMIAQNQIFDQTYLPFIEKNEGVQISQFTLKELIRQTIFSIAVNENNKLMTGELFEIEENKLRVVSLDGHRISIRYIEMKNHYDSKKVVVPGKTLQEISKIIPGSADEDVVIYITNNHIVFEFENTTVVSRLIEGEYFKIDQMLSSDYDTKVRINKRELLDCIDRATLLVKEGDKKPIIMNITDGNMELRINSFIGSMNEDIDIDKDGKDIMIGFNPKFFIDALRVIDEEEVNLYMVNPKAPCFIKDDEGKFIYLILPVNFNTAAVILIMQ